MSILSSLFGSKKRAKKSASVTASSTSSSPPPSSKAKARASSPTDRPSGPTRFASIRRKSSAVAVETIQRRNSSEFGRKKQVAAPSEAPGKEWELPVLGFGDGITGDGEASGSGLGLGSMVGMPSLTLDELERLRGATFSVDQVARIWKVLGAVLKDTGECDVIPRTVE